MTLANICASSGSAASSAPKAAAGSASTAGLALIFAAMGLAFGFIMMDMMSGLAMAFAIKAMGSTFSTFPMPLLIAASAYRCLSNPMPMTHCLVNALCRSQASFRSAYCSLALALPSTAVLTNFAEDTVLPLIRSFLPALKAIC